MTQKVQNNTPYGTQTQNFMTLSWHCFKKGIQVGSVVGVVIATPLAFYLAKRKNETLKLLKFSKFQIYSLCFGVLSSMGMMTAKYVSWTNKKLCLEDRAYRINRNEMQNRVDAITTGAFLSGGLIGLVKHRSLTVALGLTTPAVVGGLIYHALTAPRKIQNQAKAESTKPQGVTKR